MDSITVKAPATSANLGAGFDVMGIALDSPYDVVEVEKADRLSIVTTGRGAEGIPAEPEKNTAGIVALELGRPVRITVRSGIRPGSGLGSSAAPAAGVAVAINELFGLGYTREELVWIAARGEVAAAGIVHADNVAPCIMGGLTIVSRESVVQVELPPMGVVAILPEIVVSTKAARTILPREVPLEEMVRNVGKAAMLMAGVVRQDPRIIGGSLADTFNERYRAPLIKGYEAVRDGALAEGAHGVAISGSGPTMIALCPAGKEHAVAASMRDRFAAAGVASEAYVTRIGKGVQIGKRDGKGGIQWA